MLKDYSFRPGKEDFFRWPSTRLISYNKFWNYLRIRFINVSITNRNNLLILYKANRIHRKVKAKINRIQTVQNLRTVHKTNYKGNYKNNPHHKIVLQDWKSWRKVIIKEANNNLSRYPNKAKIFFKINTQKGIIKKNKLVIKNLLKSQEGEGVLQEDPVLLHKMILNHKILSTNVKLSKKICL